MSILGKANDAGFALLEVVTATMAAALVLTLYLQIVGRSGSAHVLANDRFVVASFAQSKIEQLGLEPLNEGITRGTYADLFHWTLKVEPDIGYAERQDGLRPWHVTVGIEWTRGRTTRKAVYTSVRLDQNEVQKHAP